MVYYGSDCQVVECELDVGIEEPFRLSQKLRDLQISRRVGVEVDNESIIITRITLHPFHLLDERHVVPFFLDQIIC